MAGRAGSRRLDLKVSKRPLSLSATCRLLAIVAYFVGTGSTLCGVQVNGTVVGPDGKSFSGWMTVRHHAVTHHSNQTVIRKIVTVAINAGLVSLELPANSVLDPLDLYEVRFQGCNNVDFTQFWSIPPSSSPLDIANIQAVSAGRSATLSADAAPEESIRDADQLIEGPGFGLGAVAVVNANGQIETAVGNLGDCLYVDGTSGPCGVSASEFVDNETPSGNVNGMNVAFQLANTPASSSLKLYRNGLYMTPGSDYALTGSAIQFINGVVPQPNDNLIASYRVAPGNAGTRALRRVNRGYRPLCGTVAQ